MSTSAAYRELVEVMVRRITPDQPLEIDKWAEAHMILPKDAAEPGPYRIDRTPPARRIMQCLSPVHPCKRVVIRGASQMMKTQIGLNFLCASAHLAPGNMLVLEPTDQLVKRLSARVSKTIRDVAVLREVFAAPRSRDSRNTVYAKDFGGNNTMYIATAGSAANLAEIPARYVFIDEVDRLEVNVDGEGDPVALAEARATTFQSNCKFFEVSSPTLVGQSKIDTLFERGTQEVYLVPCPHCAHRFEFTIDRFKYERQADSGNVVRAWFVCPECGAEVEEARKGRMIAAAAAFPGQGWHARSNGDGETVSFHVSAFYAQAGSITWKQLASEHATAKDRQERGDPGAMQVFYNTRLALSWENALERTTAQALMSRRDSDLFPPRVIPSRALVLTMAVDTQSNRLELQVEAWGPDLEHWVIDHQVLLGSPAELPENAGSVWQRLDEYRKTPFQHETGVRIPISAFAIDSGGSNTQDVYNYGQARQQVGCLIVHGSSRPDRPIVSNTPAKVTIDWGGKRTPDGALLWTIGTDIAKDHLHNRWKLAHGGGAMHFHELLSLDWFEQLVAERPVLKKRPGGGMRRVWEKASHGDRNEALDLSVYNLGVAHHLGLHKWSALDWRRLRDRLVPKTAEVEVITVDAAAGLPPPSPPPATSVPSVPPRGRRMLSRGF